MSKIGTLLKEICNNGVEFKCLSDFTKVLRGKRLTTKELSDDGEYPVFHGGLEPLGFYHEYNRLGDTVMIINVGASAGTIGYSEKDFWSSDGCYCLEKNELFIPKFLYYYLKNNEEYFVSKVRKAGIPTLDGKIIEKFKIPILPISIQQEIVSILDKMDTELISYLSEEQNLRTKQYEYWKRELLDIEHKKYPIVKLEEICIYSKDRISYNELNQDNYISVENLLQNKKGKTISSHVPTSGNSTKFIPEDILIGNIRPYLKKIWLSDCVGGTNGDVLDIRIKDANVINSKYLFYILSSDDFFEYDNINSKGAKMPRGSKDLVMKYQVSLPTLEEQIKIVKILDRFESLLNDIDNGIPAEIELRKKQYEYYRNKLLSFEELMVNE